MSLLEVGTSTYVDFTICDKRQWGGDGTGKSKIKIDDLRFGGY